MQDITVNIVEEPVQVTVTEEIQQVTVQENPVNVEIVETPVDVIISNEQVTIEFPDPNKVGPKGEKGDPGTLVTYFADIALGSQRVVRKNPLTGKVTYASTSNIEDAFSVLGITRNSALPDDPVEVYISGEVQSASWDFIVNEPVFLGLDGFVTQTASTSNFSLMLGMAISFDTIFLRVEYPIFLN